MMWSCALLLCLFSVPANAYRTVFKNSCEDKSLGDACNDRHSDSQPGICVETRCMDSANFFAMGAAADGEEVEPVWFDCYACRNPEQLAEARMGLIRLRVMQMLALGAVGAATFVWYRRRRRSMAMSPPPQDRS